MKHFLQHIRDLVLISKPCARYARRHPSTFVKNARNERPLSPLPAIPCGTAWLLTLTIKMLISWSSRVFLGICQRAVPNHTSILLKIESARRWRSCQVLNLSKNWSEKENWIYDSKNRSELKESSISSVTSTNIYLLINRFLQRIGKSVFKLSFTIITDKIFFLKCSQY